MIVETIIGIDPGKGGGVAVYRPNREVQVYKMPDFDTLAELLKVIREMDKYILVFMEKVQMRHGDKHSGKMFRMEKMLANYEQVKAIMKLLKIPFCLVHPMKWQGVMNLRKQGEEYGEKKKRFNLIAKNIYPAIGITLATCDAVLIMEFGRKILRVDPMWVKENVPDEALKMLI